MNRPRTPPAMSPTIAKRKLTNMEGVTYYMTDGRTCLLRRLARAFGESNRRSLHLSGRKNMNVDNKTVRIALTLALLASFNISAEDRALRSGDWPNYGNDPGGM